MTTKFTKGRNPDIYRSKISPLRSFLASVEMTRSYLCKQKSSHPNTCGIQASLLNCAGALKCVVYSNHKMSCSCRYMY